ncbi:MAG: YrbL family protein [Pseudomonadota bacterium]
MTGIENAKRLQLCPAALVGKGWHRECYVHPDNPLRCVKVVVSGSGNENHREQRYYHELMKRGVSWEMLPRFYGLIDTNLGEAAVFDLIRDYSGEVSLPLQHYLSTEGNTIGLVDVLAQAMAALRDYLLEQRIVTMTLKPKNILFQRSSPDTGKLVLVDNIGNSDFVPLARYSALFARQKIRRKWHRLEALIRADFRHNPAVASLLNTVATASGTTH